MLIVVVTLLLISLGFLLLLLTSSVISSEFSLFLFFLTLSLSFSLLGVTLLFFTPRIVQWHTRTFSSSNRSVMKIFGWSDKQIATEDSIYSLSSSAAFKWGLWVFRIMGVLLVLSFTWLFFSTLVSFVIVSII